MLTNPERGIVSIDGDLYGITIPQLPMVSQMWAAGFKYLDDNFTLLLDRVDPAERRSELWNVSSKEVGLMFYGEPDTDGNIAIWKVEKDIGKTLFKVIPVLVPLDKNKHPVNIRQYRDGESVTFGSWTINGRFQRTQHIEDLQQPQSPCRDIGDNRKVKLVNTRDDPDYQLHWYSWHGLLVLQYPLFRMAPHKAMLSGFVCDYLPPLFRL